MKYCDCDHGKCFGGPIDACVFEFCRKSSAPPTGSTALFDAADKLAKLAIQSDRYATDTEYRDAVDDVLSHTLRR